MNELMLLALMGCLQASTGATVTCAWQPAPAGAGPTARFILSLAQNQQEIENQYIGNATDYARVLQYLNHDLAQDVFLRLPGQPDSVAAVAVSYPRQYGTTGRSSVLLVFPVPEAQLRRGGGYVSFRGAKLGLENFRFFFSAPNSQVPRPGRPAR